MAMLFTKNGCTFLRGKFDRSGRYIERNTLVTFFLLPFLETVFFSWWHVIVYSDWMPSLSCVHKLLQIKSSWMIEMSHIESPSLHVRRFGGRAVPKSFCARSPESTKFWPSIGEGKQSVDIWDVYGWSFLRDCFGWIQECWTKHYLVLKMCSSCFWKDCQCLSSIVDVMLLFWMWCFIAISAWNWTIKFASIGTMPMAWAQIDETLVWFYISSIYQVWYIEQVNNFTITFQDIAVFESERKDSCLGTTCFNHDLQWFVLKGFAMTSKSQQCSCQFYLYIKIILRFQDIPSQVSTI